MDSPPFSPAAERNRKPILAVLKNVLPAQGFVLEIGSGAAQHVTLFAQAMPGWQWQPSEIPENMARLQAGLSVLDQQSANIDPPIALDVSADWPEQCFDAIYSANTAHIMSWPEVEVMFSGVAEHLVPEGYFILYGPFRFGSMHHAESNAAFDQSLRNRDPSMGIRDVEQLDALAESVGVTRTAELAMPANNHILVFQPSNAEK